MHMHNISPIDGKYKKTTSILSNYFSEKALIYYRVYVEINYFLSLIDEETLKIRKISNIEREFLVSICNVTDEDLRIVKSIETTGYNDIKATNHDVKAIEYFIKLKLKDTSLSDLKEFVHFCLTSEDINNIAYSLMIRDAFNNIIYPELIEIYHELYERAYDKRDIPMLARTHGQPASPTTVGKELLVFVERLKKEITNIFNSSLYAKLNGATGNYNSFNVVLPDVDWIKFSRNFIEKICEKTTEVSTKYSTKLPIKIKFNAVTTQIENHDGLCSLFDNMKRINNILVDLAQDAWRYISDGWLVLTKTGGEVGSSTMPHKINPIDFENAEGNFLLSNALFEFFSRKLSISRLQRDLSDSTVLRNIGVAFAHTLVAYKSIRRGFLKVGVNEKKVIDELNSSPEVITEALQTILRFKGLDSPYEMLKSFSQGKEINMEKIRELISSIEKIDTETKMKLLDITPSSYIGLASKIVKEFDPKIN